MRALRKCNIVNLVMTSGLLLIFGAGMQLMFEAGILSDEYGSRLKEAFFSAADFLLILAAPAVLAVLNICVITIKRIGENERVRASVFILSGIVLAAGICSAGNVFGEMREYRQENVAPNTYILLENLDEVNRLAEENETGFLYIKRDDCQQCEEMGEFLDSFSVNKKVYIYSTSMDRDKNAEALYACLDELGVDCVPLILEYENGSIINRYSSEDKEKIREALSGR